MAKTKDKKKVTKTTKIKTAVKARKKSPKRQEKKENKVLIKSVAKADALKIALLKSELHYFKGLSVLITILILCVFLAFGVLFGAMYLETKVMRQVFQQIISVDESYETNLIKSSINKDSEIDEAKMKKLTSSHMVLDVEDWLDFSKYGVSIKFPNSWTYSDNPYDKEISFYTDGKVHEFEESDSAQLLFKFDVESWASKYDDSVHFSYGGQEVMIRSYPAGEKTTTLMVFPDGNDSFIELTFDKKDISFQTVVEMLQGLEFID